MNGDSLKRINSIDVARGFVMIIMALDHVRDMIHNAALTESPTNLATTTPVLFFTRWITYLCAPAFVFLAGTSAYLSFQRSKNISATRSFLLKRGFYLILLEFIVVGFGLFFDVGFHTLLFEVIAAIGVGFIILAFLITLPTTVIAILGIAIIALHNLLPVSLPPDAAMNEKIFFSLFRLNVFPMTGRALVIAYPPIPWLGIMLAGFATGNLFMKTTGQRKKIFFRSGVTCILLFITLRYFNQYGDPIPWQVQSNGVLTFLSFMNVTKYPPSLIFCLVTLGVMFLLLALFENARGKLINILSVYGKVPLFYFLVHFYLIHIILLVVLKMQGFHCSEFDFASGNFGRVRAVPSGLPLWAIYLIWAGVVAVLYLPCRWFGKYKAKHDFWWLRYL